MKPTAPRRSGMSSTDIIIQLVGVALLCTFVTVRPVSPEWIRPVVYALTAMTVVLDFYRLSDRLIKR